MTPETNSCLSALKVPENAPWSLRDICDSPLESPMPYTSSGVPACLSMPIASPRLPCRNPGFSRYASHIPLPDCPVICSPSPALSLQTQTPALAARPGQRGYLVWNKPANYLNRCFFQCQDGETVISPIRLIRW